MNQQTENADFQQILILSSVFLLGLKIVNTLIEPHNTVNYKLFYKRKLVYHGITFEDRLDNRLFEHGIKGFKFDDCVYDFAKPRSKALRLERNRIKRDRPKYNIHHNCF